MISWDLDSGPRACTTKALFNHWPPRQPQGEPLGWHRYRCESSLPRGCGHRVMWGREREERKDIRYKTARGNHGAYKGDRRRRERGVGGKRGGEKRGGQTRRRRNKAVPHMRGPGVLWSGTSKGPGDLVSTSSSRRWAQPPWASLGLDVWSLASPKPHGPSFQSDRNPQGPWLQDP